MNPEAASSQLKQDQEAYRLAEILSDPDIKVVAGEKWGISPGFDEETKKRILNGEALPDDAPRPNKIHFPKDQIGDTEKIRKRVSKIRHELKTQDYQSLVGAIERNEVIAPEVTETKDGILKKIAHAVGAGKWYDKWTGGTKHNVKNVLKDVNQGSTPPTPPQPQPPTPPEDSEGQEEPPDSPQDQPDDSEDDAEDTPDDSEDTPEEEQDDPGEIQKAREEMAAAPEDEENYTPPPMSEEPSNKEGEPNIVIRYEIEPVDGSKAPTGKFVKKRFSHYDKSGKNWHAKTNKTPYNESPNGSKRYRMYAKLTGGEKFDALPLPPGHEVDASTLQFSGNNCEIFKDEKGAFFLKAKGAGDFSVEFVHTGSKPQDNPETADTDILYNGTYSSDTENLLKKLKSSSLNNTAKVQALASYIQKKYKYPGDGQDLSDAANTQSRLHSTSTSENYLPNIEAEEAIECHSAATLFIDFCRKLSIPSRSIGGFAVSKTKDGKSQITDSDGHAWVEIWDGAMWQTIDPTPTQTEEKPEGDNQDQDNTEKEDISDEITPDEDLDEMQEIDEGEDAQAEAEKESFEQAKKYSEEIRKAQSAQEIKDIMDEIAQDEKVESYKEELENLSEEQVDRLKDIFSQKLDQIEGDGFMEEHERERWDEKLDNTEGIDQLARLEQELEIADHDYAEYLELRKEVLPLVDKWYKKFIRALPKKRVFVIDENMNRQKGSKLDRSALMRPASRMTGKVFQPRVLKEEEPKPKFMAVVALDDSGSMAPNKRESKKMLLFFCELFDKIEKELGYTRFAAFLFAEGITDIKSFDDDYSMDGRRKKSKFSTGQPSTIKKRIIKEVKPNGGTYMVEATQKASRDLEAEKKKFPNYRPAFYLIGDGADSAGRFREMKKIIETGIIGTGVHSAVAIDTSDSIEGDGEEIRLLKMFAKRAFSALAQTFGAEKTQVGTSMEEVADKVMKQVLGDMKDYTKKVQQKVR